MKNKKIKNKYMFGIFALAVIAVLGVGVAVASPLGKVMKWVWIKMQGMMARMQLQ